MKGKDVGIIRYGSERDAERAVCILLLFQIQYEYLVTKLRIEFNEYVVLRSETFEMFRFCGGDHDLSFSVDFKNVIVFLQSREGLSQN